MTDDSEVARIAEGLPPSVRAYVLAPFYTAIAFGIRRAWFSDTGYWAGRQAAKAGLGERRIIEPGVAVLIPNELGLAMRSYLQRKGGDA